MKLGKKIWDYAGWFVAVYTIYNQFKTLNQAKDEFYSTMEPSQQARWDAIFGKPANATPVTPAAILAAANAPLNVPPTLTQVLSGT